nr:flagellar protein FlaG [uncultured Noviherbaspirillum sp.]
MNIAPVAAGALSTVQGIAGSQPEGAVATRRQVAAAPQETAIGKTGTTPGEADPAELKQRVDELNAAMKVHASSIQFSIDDDSGRTIVKVVDTDTDTVLRQYPSKELLAISKQIDKFQGMFVKTQA